MLMRDFFHESEQRPSGAAALLRVQSFAELRAAATGLSPLVRATPLTEVLAELRLYPEQRQQLLRQAVALSIAAIGPFVESAELHERLRLVFSKRHQRQVVQLLGEWLAARSGVPAPVAPWPEDVTTWAVEHGVADCAEAALADLPDDVAPLAQKSAYLTVAGVFDRHYPTHGNPGRLRETLWTWLQNEAKAVDEARRRGPARPPKPNDPALRELWDRLSAARAALEREFPARSRATHVGIQLDTEPLAIACDVKRREARINGYPKTPRVTISLPRAGAPELACSCGRDRCVHRAMCLDAALRMLSDEAHALPAAIRNELSQTVWQKALGFQVTARRAASPPAQAVSFELLLGEKDVRLSVLAHRIGKKGPSATGKPIRALRALALPGLEPADRLVLQHLVVHEESRWSEPSAGSLAEAVLALDGHPGVVCDGNHGIEPVTVRLARIGVRFDETPAGLRTTFALGGEPLDLKQCLLLPCRGGRLVVHDTGNTVWLALADEETLGFLSGVTRYEPVFPAEAHDALLARLEQLPAIEAALPPSLAGQEVPAAPRPVVRVEPSDVEGLELRLLIRPAEGAEPLAPGEGPERSVFRREGQRCFTVRDPVAERSQAAELAKRLELPARDDFTWTVGEPLAAIAMVDRLEGLARAGLDVEWPASRWRLTRPAKTSDVKVQVSRKRDWFGLDGEVEVDGERVQLAVLLDSVRKRRRWVRLKERQWLRLSQDLVDRLQGLAHVAQQGAEGVEVTWAALPALEALEGQLEQLQVAKDFAEVMQRVREAERSEPEVPAELKASLRDYQVQGFRWLARLAGWGAGACLADDMGLGKTVQALALLLARAKLGPALVVAPTSVVFNWQKEAAKFAPSLKVHEYRTADRTELLGKLGPNDVVLTSWALLTRDALGFASREWATLVLDEAQAIKNATTLRAKAARGLKAGFKVALSGTPLENHLGELWSLYRVVLPGLFGSLEQFRARFALPIERDADPAARQALAAVVRPFLLRRNKSEVATELPARTELAVHVELTDEERRLYDDARLAAIGRLEGGEGPAEQKRFQALAALTRLRQIACHPRLYDDQWQGPASKLARLLELLADLKDAGHRALVFSQFTSHLALVRDAVTAAGFSFQYLDGSTPAAARQAQVEAFQRGESDLFLISLKAGGVGLNLTAADYVVHLDPWWNPAVEDQATDRTHRIGQLKPVTVYRLIARGTVEEGIVSLHEEKRNLVAGVLDGSGAAGALSAEELVKLIRGEG